ncbi:MAG: malate synthase A [Deltaproteobacteria bacterium]|nr:malate synthase A [Deltaproteobacteria bacterium]
MERVAGVSFLGELNREREEILSSEALAFVARLVRRFRPRIRELLEARWLRDQGGRRPAFLPETRAIREGAWRCAPVPPCLEDRRVEITGPVDRKMIINALNSGANVFMADFEDALSPTLGNCFDGQVHLRDAVRRTIRYEQDGKEYALRGEPAVLFVRPRGLHLLENHLLVDGEPAPAMLVDFGLFFFHNAKPLIEQGRGPFFYLPKMESHLEARLWNDVFIHAQSELGLPIGTIKATCLLETIWAVFESDEILFELREHSAGLNCGRWDYIFSYIKAHRNDPNRVLPDRALVTMTQPFMRAYTRLVIRNCHRRGVHAIGGMAAQIPVKDNPQLNQMAIEKVKEDKLREVQDGHDGTWVAHPGLVPVAKEVFDAHMPGKNQIQSTKQLNFNPTEEELLETPKGSQTESGLRQNIRVALQYLESWLRGKGAVPINHLMEDTATAEICRAQIWQWLKHGVVLDTGLKVTKENVIRLIDEEGAQIEKAIGGAQADIKRLNEAKALLVEVSTAEPMHEFLTIPAYSVLLSLESRKGV